VSATPHKRRVPIHGDFGIGCFFHPLSEIEGKPFCKFRFDFFGKQTNTNPIDLLCRIVTVVFGLFPAKFGTFALNFSHRNIAACT
jgi:hypothetical protein